VQPPDRPLCQHEGGSCAACCGLYNFADRSAEAIARRLDRRSALVGAAWPDQDALASARDTLLAEEKPDKLFDGVKVCPFAGWVEPGRVGCLLHPTRHPDGADLRDLAVYPKEVCRDHFCAPHDWLRPVEVSLAQTARGVRYGLVVTDAGVIKAVRSLVEGALGRGLRDDDVTHAHAALAAFWTKLLDWQWRDPDPRRFGGFYVVGDEAVERTLPSCLAGIDLDASAAQRAVLDGLGTQVSDVETARRALAHLSALIDEVAQAMLA
jgi:hypothetical protein